VRNDPVDRWDWLLIRKRCHAEARRIVRAPQDAEEVVQEALARAWRSRRSCRTPETPLPWVLQITRHEAYRRLRQQRDGPTGAPLDDYEHLVDGRSGRDGERSILKLDVAQALKELSTDERLLITLRYGLDWSHPEIAGKLEIPEATARVRLHRAHRRLQAVLEEDA
jgi:RNA polymerase sigma-70 factor (ECF subfamily)